MKDIKDYLHLYLGCDVMHEDGTTATIVNVDMHTAGFIHHDTVMYGEQSKDNWKNKLILRPLSDMTEEEKTCKDAAGKEGWELTKKSYVIDGLNVERAIHYRHSREIAYLLSKGFDLFGLIESGLAIDKTTLK